MLAKKLAKKTFADYVMFQNSGAEATEAAIKVARRYFYSIGKPKKNRILCVKNSFHGRTLAAIYASGSKKMTEGFGPKVNGFDHFNFGDHKSLKKLITKKCDVIILGCTELPLAIKSRSYNSIPLLDSTEILASSLLKKSIEKQDGLK